VGRRKGNDRRDAYFLTPLTYRICDGREVGLFNKRTCQYDGNAAPLANERLRRAEGRGRGGAGFYLIAGAQTSNKDAFRGPKTESTRFRIMSDERVPLRRLEQRMTAMQREYQSLTRRMDGLDQRITACLRLASLQDAEMAREWQLQRRTWARQQLNNQVLQFGVLRSVQMAERCVQHTTDVAAALVVQGPGPYYEVQRLWQQQRQQQQQQQQQPPPQQSIVVLDDDDEADESMPSTSGGASSTVTEGGASVVYAADRC